MNVSQMLLLLNRLKAEANHDWLTDNQLRILADIEQLWRFPERVNLWGTSGSGKTMVGWIVARSLGATVYPSLRTFRERSQYGEEQVIIDNVSIGHTALRTLLAEIQLKNITTALLITNLPNRIGLPAIEMPTPTTRDFDILYRNLSLMEHYALSPLHEGNFWDIIHSVL